MGKLPKVVHLKWNNFRSSLTDGFQNLLRDETMVDVTLAAEGKCLKAHKVMLSVWSPYLRTLLQNTSCQHTTVIMTDVSFNVLSSMLRFMYDGEIKIRHNNIAEFFKLAEKLQVTEIGSESSQLVRNFFKRKEAKTKKKASRYSCTSRLDRLKVLSKARNNNKLLKKQRMKRSAQPLKSVKKFKQNSVYEDMIDSESGDSDDINILTDSTIVHRHNDDSGDKDGPSPNSLTKKSDNEGTQNPGLMENNLQFGICDYFKNVTNENLESDIHSDLIDSAQNSLENNQQKRIQRATPYASQGQEEIDSHAYREYTSISQSIDLPKDVENTSKNDKPNDLQRDIQKVGHSDVRSFPQSSGKNPLQTDKPNDFLNAQYHIQRNVHNASQNEVQYHVQRETQSVPSNNEQCTLPRNGGNVSSSNIQYSLQRDIENASQNDVQYPIETDNENLLPIDLHCSVPRPVQNVSTNDLQYSSKRDVQNISLNNGEFSSLSGAQKYLLYDIQNGPPRDVSPINLHHSRQRDVQSISANKIQYPLRRNVQNDSRNNVQDIPSNDEQYSVQRELENLSPLNLHCSQQDPQPVNLRVPRPGDMEDTAPRDLQCPIQSDSRNSPINLKCRVQREVPNDLQYPLPRDKRNASLIDLPCRTRRDVQTVLPNGIQYSPKRNVENNLSGDVEYPLPRDKRNTPPIDLQCPRLRAIQNLSPIDLHYPSQRNVKANDNVQYPSPREVQNVLAKDLQYSAQDVPNVSPNNTQYSLERDMQNVMPNGLRYSSRSDAQKSLLNDIQTEWQDDLPNDRNYVSKSHKEIYSEKEAHHGLKTNIQYVSRSIPLKDSQIRENITENVAQSKMQYESRAEVALRSQKAAQNYQNKSLYEDAELTPNGDENNVEEDGVEFRTSTEPLVDSQESADSDEENALQIDLQVDSQEDAQSDEENALQNDRREDSHKNVNCAPESDTNIFEQSEVQSTSQTEEQFKVREVFHTYVKDPRKNVTYALNTATGIAEPKKMQSVVEYEEERQVQKVLHTYLKKDPRKNVQYALSGGKKLVEQSKVPAVSEGDGVFQNHSEKDLRKDVEHAQNSGGNKSGEGKVHDDKQTQARKDSQRNEQSTSKKGSKIDEKSNMESVSQTKAQIDSQNNSKSDEQKSSKRSAKNTERDSQNYAMDLRRSAQQASKRGAKDVDENEIELVTQDDKTSDKRSDSRNDIKGSRHENQESSVRSYTNNTDESEVQFVLQTKAKRDSEKRARSNAQKDSHKKLERGLGSGTNVGELSEAQSTSQPQQKHSGSNILENGLSKESHSGQNTGGSDDEESEVQFILETKSQANLKKNAKRAAQKGFKGDAIDVEDNEVEFVSQIDGKSDKRNARNDRKKYRHRNAQSAVVDTINIDESEVQFISQTSSEDVLVIDTQDSMKNVQNIPKKRSKSDDQAGAQLTSTIKVEPSPLEDEQSTAQDAVESHEKDSQKTHSVWRDPARSEEHNYVQSMPQNEKRSDELNGLQNDLQKDPDTDVQHSDENYVDDNDTEDDMDSDGKAQSEPPKTSPSDLQNVLLNTHLDSRENEQRKEGEQCNAQPESPKDSPRNVQTNGETDVTKVVDSVCQMTPSNAGNDIDSNENSTEPNASEFLSPAEVETDPQTSAKDTVNNEEENVLPPLPSNAPETARQRLESSLKEVASRILGGPAKKKASAPNILVKNVKNIAGEAEGISSKIRPKTSQNSETGDETNVTESQSSHKKKEKKSQVQNDGKCDAGRVSLNALHGFSQNHVQTTPLNPAPCTLVYRRSNASTETQTVSDSNLQKTRHIPVQPVVKCRNDANHIPTKGTLRVAQNLFPPSTSSQKNQPILKQLAVKSNSDANNIPSSGSQRASQSLDPQPIPGCSWHETPPVPAPQVFKTYSDAKHLPWCTTKRVSQKPSAKPFPCPSLQRISNRPVQVVVQSNSDANSIPSSGPQRVAQNLPTEIPIKYVFQCDQERDAQSGSQKVDSQRKPQNNLPNASATGVKVNVPPQQYVFSSAQQQRPQTFLGYNGEVITGVPYSEVQYVIPGSLQVDAHGQVRYAAATYVNNAARSATDLTVRNNALTNSESNVPNVVQTQTNEINPVRTGVQRSVSNNGRRAVRNDKGKTPPSEAPKVSQTDTQAVQDPNLHYSLIMQNVAQNRFLLPLGPPQNMQYTLINPLNSVPVGDAQGSVNNQGQNAVASSVSTQPNVERSNAPTETQGTGGLVVKTVNNKRTKTTANNTNSATMVANPITPPDGVRAGLPSTSNNEGERTRDSSGENVQGKQRKPVKKLEKPRIYIYKVGKKKSEPGNPVMKIGDVISGVKDKEKKKE